MGCVLALFLGGELIGEVAVLVFLRFLALFLLPLVIRLPAMLRHGLGVAKNLLRGISEYLHRHVPLLELLLYLDLLDLLHELLDLTPAGGRGVVLLGLLLLTDALVDLVVEEEALADRFLVSVAAFLRLLDTNGGVQHPLVEGEFDPRRPALLHHML